MTTWWPCYTTSRDVAPKSFDIYGRRKIVIAAKRGRERGEDEQVGKAREKHRLVAVHKRKNAIGVILADDVHLGGVDGQLSSQVVDRAGKMARRRPTKDKRCTVHQLHALCAKGGMRILPGIYCSPKICREALAAGGRWPRQRLAAGARGQGGVNVCCSHGLLPLPVVRLRSDRRLSQAGGCWPNPCFLPASR